jgi:hypothetical protein
MKTTISTLIAFSVLGLVAPPAGALDSKSFDEQRDPLSPLHRAPSFGRGLSALSPPSMAPEIYSHAIVIGLNAFESGRRE